MHLTTVGFRPATLSIGAADLAEPRDAGADVGRHRRAVPAPGRPARRRPGRVGNDRERRRWSQGSREATLRAEGAGRRPPRGAARRLRAALDGAKARASPRAAAPTIIDINMGCPAKHVTSGQSGSALMRDLDHALDADRGDGRRGVGAGDAEDAARLGRSLDQRARARAPRRSGRRAHDHRAWPHPLPVLQGHAPTGRGARGQGRRRRSRSSSTATSAPSTMPRARSRPPAPTR